MDALLADDPVQLGPYRLTGRLGGGGMGQVYAGVSPAGRRVAVKMIRPEYAADVEFRARFAREVEAARAVGGFHTAQVVDADTDAELPWLATAFVDGPPLSQVVAELGPLHASVVRTLGAGLAEGLAAIHARGLVHRDLKPGNIIMAGDGPRIIDFGVARAEGTDPLTAEGTPVGTFAFMAPEQVHGDPSGPPCDVFALGCVLVHAATGRSPFDAATVPAIVHRVLTEAPVLDRVPPGLRPVAQACLVKHPAARPTAEQALAMLRAAPASQGVPRRALLMGAAGAAGMAVVLGVPGLLLLPGDKQQAAAPAASPSPSDSSGQPLLAGPRFPRAMRFDATGTAFVAAADDGAVWHFALPSRKSTNVLHLTVPKYEQATLLSPDLKLLARAEEKAVRLYSADTGSPTGAITGFPQNIVAMAFSPNGRTLAVAAGSPGKIQIADPATGRITATYRVVIRNDQVGVLAYTPDGRMLVASNNNDTLLLDAASGRTLHTLIGSRANALAVSPDSRTVAVGGIDGNIQLVETVTGRITATLGHEAQFTGAGMVYSMAFTPDGTALVSANVAPGSATVRMWNLATHQITRTFPDSNYPVAISPDGRTLAAPRYSGTDGGIQLWTLK